MIKVTDLFIYPIKSCQGIRSPFVSITPTGFLGDRQFMLVNEQGLFLTQRDYPILARVKVILTDDHVCLSMDDKVTSALTFVPMNEGNLIKVKVWGDQTLAIDQGDEVANWFQQVLNFDSSLKCRLVKQSPKHLRLIDRKYATKKNQSVSFADGFPFLLTTSASLDDLNQRLKAKYPDQNQTIPMNRFRPNIVIENDQSFIESSWQTIKIGEVLFSLVKPCSRCIITTTDQVTGTRNQLKEPLLTLTSFRQVKNQGVMFGENMIAENTGLIKECDIVEVIKSSNEYI